MATLTPRDLGIIQEKMCSGDVATDEELKFFVQHCKPTLVVLENLDNKFHLAWAELVRCVSNAERYLRERQSAGIEYVSVGGSTVRTKIHQVPVSNTHVKIPQTP